MNKKQEAFKRNVEKVEEIIKVVSEEYRNKKTQNTWRYPLDTQIIAKVQLELCVTERKAKEYVKLVKVKMRSFN